MSACGNRIYLKYTVYNPILVPPPVRSIGLSGFDNPLRDPKTDELKKHVGQGVKIKMDDAGNILIRRYAKSNVYIKSTASAPNEETAIGADILKLPQQALEAEKIVKVRPGSVICILLPSNVLRGC